MFSLHSQDNNTFDSDLIQMILLHLRSECSIHQINYVKCCDKLHCLNVNIALVQQSGAHTLTDDHTESSVQTSSHSTAKKYETSDSSKPRSSVIGPAPWTT